jgi:hypothetical protein
MSTWTSRLAAALALAGCTAAGPPAPAARQGGLVVAAPAGFCIAPGTRAAAGAGQFVAFRRCRGPGPVLTATVGAAGSAAGLDLSGAAVAAYAGSQAGRRALSRAGDPASVALREVLVADGAVLIRLTDAAPAPAPMAPGDSWRAVFALDGRLVTLTASGTVAAALDRDSGRAVIGRFVGAMQAANAG